MKQLAKFSTSIFFYALTFLVSAVLIAPAAQAQAGSGTIFGTITDPSGAVVAGATATLLNTETGHSDVVKSNARGAYVFPTVDVGSYQFTVTATGFQTFISQNIIMQVNENREIDARLAVGSISQQIVVRQGQAHVDLRSSTITEVVDSRRVKDLPLNGRNPLDLQTLVAGAGGSTDLSGQQQNSMVSINGGRFNANNYTLDGVDNEDPFFNSPSIVPNPDALSQFSIETSNYGAREGRGSGAQINAVIKSGTNHFHGSLFEYWRNPALDAKPYFSTAVSPYRRNQFGGTFGGPILHNKLFFFFAYQGTRTHASPNAETIFVPSPAELAGNFSELLTVDSCNGKAVHIKNPTTKKPYPGNQIPASDLNQAALKYAAAFIPQANGACNSYTFAPPTTQSEDQYISRVDSNLGRKDTLSGHLIYVPSDNMADNTNQSLPGFFAKIHYTNWHVAVNETHVFSPRLLNLFTFGFDRIDRIQLPVMPKQLTWGDLGAGIVRAAPKAPIGADTNVKSYFRGMTPWPLTQLRKEYQVSDYLSWTLGNHSLSIGGDLRRYNTFQSQDFQTDAQLTFTTAFTGNALSDFLTGYPNHILQKSPNDGHPQSLAPDLYFQDDWRATRRLTLNLGIRWEPFVPFVDSLNHVSQFRPGQQSTVFPTAPAGYVFPGDAGVSKATFPARWADFSPRAGFAFDVFGNGKTALRAGAGIYRASIRMQSENGLSLGEPYSLSLSLQKPSGGLSDPYKDIGGSPFPLPPPPSPSERGNYQFALPISLKDLAPDFRNGVSYQWNLNIQQQLPWQVVTTIAYVGNTGAHLLAGLEVNPGLASLDGKRKYAPDFGSINREAPVVHSSYQALQATLDRRFSNGFTVLANYTWSKMIDNGFRANLELTDPISIPANRGLADLDIRNNFVASGIWDLPSPRSANPLALAFLKGWQLNGIWHMHSGTPFTVVSGVDNSMSHVNSDWADVHGHGRTYPHESRPQQIQHYFNTEIYTENAVGTFGNSGRNSLIGPGEDLVTLGVVKSLFTREQFKVLLRAEAFNVFNHPVMHGPNQDVSSSKVGQITSAGDPRVGQLALRIEF